MDEDLDTGGPVVRVEFGLTREEWGRFTRWQLLHLPGMRWVGVGLALVLVGSVIELLAGNRGVGEVALAVCVVWIGWWAWMAASAARRSWAKRGDDIGAHQVLEFSDAGVRSQTRHTEAKTDWAVYTRLVEHDGLLLLGTKNRLLYRIVPRRAFASAEDEAAFRRIVKAHV